MNDAALVQAVKVQTARRRDDPDYYGYNFSREWNDEAAEHALGNTSHEHHAMRTHQQLCGELDTYVRAFQVSAPQQDTWCQEPAAWQDIFQINKDLVDKSYAWFNPMHTFESTHSGPYKSKRDACHEARHRHQVRVAECHRIQHDFESKFCSYAGAIDNMCSTYEDCYDEEYAAFLVTNQSVADMEVQFKAQQWALEHLLCYGDEILADKTDLDNCDLGPCEGCSRLDINYRLPHDKKSCTEEVPTRPCEDEWNTEHYTDYDADSGIAIDECRPCVQ